MKFEQAKRQCAHLERILLVCGAQNAGKSKRLRSMFADPRFGKNEIPTTGPIAPVRLSRERGLIIRATSPHEYGDTLNEFLEKINEGLKSAWFSRDLWRVSFACAIQPRAANNMPDAVATCRALHNAFWPERIRLVQIHPRQDNNPGDLLSDSEIDQLRNIAPGSSVEVVTIDGRQPDEDQSDTNAFFLSSFFDFT